MPWREVSMSDARREFVRLALLEGANRRDLCRRFGIHPETGYKWIARWRAGDRDLADRSRRPLSSPRRSQEVLEAAVAALRAEHPAWGARKIAHCLAREDIAAPAVSTVHAILARHGLILPPQGGAPAALRFEKEAPNQLWQMDFKGWVRLGDSSFCPDQQGRTVRDRLTGVFRRHGLPEALFVDNGKPWGDSSGRTWTRLRIWLARLGVELIYARPYHPESRGKNERFHRTLKAEVFALRSFRRIEDVQAALQDWRDLYNYERPHEGIGMATPAQRYRPSSRLMPERLPEVVYDEGEIIRRVSPTRAYVAFQGRFWAVPRAFCGETLAIRPLDRDGKYGVFFAANRVATIDLSTTRQPAVQ